MIAFIETSQVEALNELCNYGGGVMKDADLPITEVGEKFISEATMIVPQSH